MAIKSEESNFEAEKQRLRFPKKDEELRNEWIRRCRRGGLNLTHSRICSAHFAPEAYETNYRGKLMGTPVRRYLKQNALPTLFLDRDDEDGYYEKTPEPLTIKRKRPRSSDDDNDLTSAHSSKIIAKSKIMRKVDGNSVKTEEIWFEVQDDDRQDDDDDEQFMEYSKVNGRTPEKGVFECSLQLTEDEDDISMFKNEITIFAEPSQMQTTSDDNADATNGNSSPDCAKKISNSCGGVQVRKSPDCVTYTSDSSHVRGQNKTKQGSETSRETLSDVPVSAKAELIDKLFSPNQLKSLLKTKKRIRWTDDEIFEAIKLRFLSLPMFNYLRNNKGYPFPGRLAVSRWAKKMKLRGGTLHSALKILELGGESSDSGKRCGLKDFCVLSLVGMKVEETVEYDEIGDEIIGPFNRMQVMMASSLTGSWQQPVFVDFDADITKDSVVRVVAELYQIGYCVVCVSTDCSDASLKLWNDLGASANTPWFSHPVKECRIVVMPDSLHAIRLVRDNLMYGGFEIEGSTIDRGPLDLLLDLGVCSKLRPYHLQPNDREARHTGTALQVLSSAVSTALIQFKPGNAQVATSTGNFLRVMRHWFDLMDVATSEPSVPFCSPYGLHRREQDRLLDLVKSIMSAMKCGKSTLQPFQIGIIMSCNGLPLLHDETKKLFNSQYITTRCLNHTSIDNVVSVLSSEFSQDPSPVIALRRLQSYILGTNLDVPSVNHSVFALVVQRAKIKLEVGKSNEFEALIADILGTIFSKTKSEYIIGNTCSRRCLNLIGEKLNEVVGNEYPQLRKHDSGSNEPTAYFLGNLFKMEKVFVDFTSGLIAAECRNIVAHLSRLMGKLPNSLPVKVIKLYARLRTEIYAQSLVPEVPRLAMKRMMHSKLLKALTENSDEQEIQD